MTFDWSSSGVKTSSNYANVAIAAVAGFGSNEDNFSNFSGSGGSQTCNSASGAFSEAIAVLKSGAPSTLMSSRNAGDEALAKNHLPEALRQFIVFRCSLNEHCKEGDFDHTAMEALAKMPFLQAMQTVEHFSASVSSRIQKKSAYLMGILRGQEAHWDKFLMANGLAGSNTNGTQTVPVANLKLKGRQILDMPAELLLFIGRCCLRGNCLPSDFTPEVCLSLHTLTLPLALKSVSAFNTNKRIIAGPKGGVINRARFFLRLIQNVSEQCSNAANGQILSGDLQTSKSGTDSNSSGSTADDQMMTMLSRDFSDELSISQQGPSNMFGLMPPAESKNMDSNHFEFNLEQLADLEFSFGAESASMATPTSSIPSSPLHMQALNRQNSIEIRLRHLENELRIRDQREQMLLLELSQTRNKLRVLQSECLKLRNVLGMYH